MHLKKSLFFLFTLFYLFLSAGITLTLHYCGKQVSSVSLYGNVDEDSCCGKSMAGKSCCSSTLLQVQLDTEHVVTSNAMVPASYDIALPPPVMQYLEATLLSGPFLVTDITAPPDKDNLPPLYLHYRMLRI